MSEGCIMPPQPPPQAQQVGNGLKRINPWASYAVPESLRSLDQLLTKRTTKVKLVLLKKSQSLSMTGEKSTAAPRPRPRTRVRMTSPSTADVPTNKEVKLIIRNEEKGTTEKINIKKCPDDNDADNVVGGWGDVMQHLKMEQSGAAVKIDIEDPEFGGGVDDSFGFPGTDTAAGPPINDYGGDEWYGDADDYDEDFPGDFPAPEVKIETEDVKDGEGCKGVGSEQSDSYNDEDDDDDDSDFGEKPSKTKKKRGRPKKSQVGKCNNTKWSRSSTWTRGKWKLKTRKGEEESMVETKPDAKMTAITLDAYVVRDVVEDPRKRNRVEAPRDKNIEDGESSVQDSAQGLTEDSSKLHNKDDNDVDVSIEAEGETGKTRRSSEPAMTEGGAGEPDILVRPKPKEENHEGKDGPGEVKGEDLEEGLQRAYRDRRLFACPFCPFVSCKKIWLAHIKRIHDIPAKRRLLWCKITPKKCGLPFTDEESREQHVQEVHVASHKCSICEKEFKFPYMLRDHMNNMHGTKMEKVRHVCAPLRQGGAILMLWETDSFNIRSCVPDGQSRLWHPVVRVHLLRQKLRLQVGNGLARGQPPHGPVSAQMSSLRQGVL